LGLTPGTKSSPKSSRNTLRKTSYGSLNLYPFRELCLDIFKEPFLRILVPVFGLILGLSHCTLSSVDLILTVSGGGATPMPLCVALVLVDAPGLMEYDDGLVPLGLGWVDARADILGLNDEKEDALSGFVELGLEEVKDDGLSDGFVRGL
jgi:hypothetical protein